MHGIMFPFRTTDDAQRSVLHVGIFLKEFDGLSVGRLGGILTVVVTGWAHWVTEGLYSLPAGHWMMYISPSLVHWMNLAASWGWG